MLKIVAVVISLAGHLVLFEILQLAHVQKVIQITAR